MKKVISSIDQIDEKVVEEITKKYLYKINKVRRDTQRSITRLRYETKKRIATSISAAFSFVIALFWRDAIQDLIDKILANLGLTGSTYIAKIIAALTVTIIGVIAISQLSQWGEDETK